MIGRLARDGSLRRQQEDLFDVRFAALGEPGVLVPARDDDSGDVEAPGRHQVRGGRLVARAEADHAVELRALDRRLDVIDDQIAAGQDVAPSPARLVTKSLGATVRISNGSTPSARSSCFSAGDLVEVGVAGREL